MQKNLLLIARLIVARHECTYVRHCKENAPIYMYYAAPETPMMSSVIAACPDLVPPNILDKCTPMAQQMFLSHTIETDVHTIDGRRPFVTPGRFFCLAWDRYSTHYSPTFLANVSLFLIKKMKKTLSDVLSVKNRI